MTVLIYQLCPVCKEQLGRRDRSMTFRAFCKDCQAMFEWPPKAETPVTVRTRLDQCPKPCGCGRCGR